MSAGGVGMSWLRLFGQRLSARWARIVCALKGHREYSYYYLGGCRCGKTVIDEHFRRSA